MWLPATIGGRLLLRPARRIKPLPILSMVTLRPASRPQRVTRSRPWPSSAVRVRRQTPPFGVAPILASSISESHKRGPLMRRLLRSVLEVIGSISQISQLAIGFGPTIPVELPGVAHRLNHVQVELAGDQLILVFRGAGQDFTAWVDKVRVAVKAANVPRRLGANPVDAAHEVTIGHGVRRL